MKTLTLKFPLPDSARPWQINVPPPRDRFFEVMHRGTRLICGYDELAEHWTCGSQLPPLEREDITHWRELPLDYLMHLWDALIANPPAKN